MKLEYSILLLIYTIYLFEYSIEQDEETHYYKLDEVHEYFNLNILEEYQYKEILNSISKIFSNSYAFNEISKNPPQPNFDENYYKKINIQEKLEAIDCSSPTLNKYEFYLKIMEALADLKDNHIKINFFEDNFDKFFLVGPFNYVIKADEENQPKIFLDSCIQDEKEIEHFENKEIIKDFCYNIDIDNPLQVISINEKDPFDYFLTFSKIIATKNIHGTFSYHMQATNYLKLDEILFDFTDDKTKQLKIKFNDEDNTEITTSYIIESDIDIYEDEEEEENFLQNNKNNILDNLLGYKKSDFYYNLFNKRIKEHKNKIFNTKLGEYIIPWNDKYSEDGEYLFKCYVDNDKMVNIYYIHSFEANNVDKYIETIKNCVKLFDKNNYPIIVINDLNSGGVVKLAQIFMGILSPLMPINLFKGRMRITESFINNKEEISEYIINNFTNIYNCEKADYDYLLNGQKKVNYSDNNNDILSEVFFLTNSSLQEEIENIRLTMKHKRKPTEILVLTDGYSFSAASLYIKYLQKQGGAIVAGYSGNIFSDDIFDSSQSPSPIFPKKILEIFNPKEMEDLNNYGIQIEFAGIQTFYDVNDINIPLEYEITPIDDRLDFFFNYNGNDDNYLSIIDKAIQILNQLDKHCFPNNKKILKLSDACDGKFGNKFTHGGYLCEGGTWTEKCEPKFCDMGYIFDEKNQICVKDICSSISDEKDEEEFEENEEIYNEEEIEYEKNEEEKEEKNNLEEEIEYEKNEEEKEEKEEIEENKNIEEQENEINNEKEEDETIYEEENEKEKNEGEFNEEKEEENNKIEEEEEKEEKEEEEMEIKEKNEKEKESEIEVYVIVIAVIGSILVIAIIFFIIHYCRKEHIKNDIDIKNDISKIELND